MGPARGSSWRNKRLHWIRGRLEHEQRPMSAPRSGETTRSRGALRPKMACRGLYRGRMFLVSKHDDEAPTPVIAELPEAVAAALRALFAKGATHGPVEAMHVLQDARRRNLWVACSCRQCDGRMPILAPRLLPSGDVTLVRLPERLAHAPDCAFAPAEGGTASSGLTPPAWRRPDFRLTPVPLSSSPAPRRAATHGDHRRISELEGKLRWLLHASAMDVVQADSTHMIQMLANVRGATQGVPITEAQHLADLFWTRAEWLHKGWASAALRRAATHGWPAGIAIQGFLLLAATRIENSLIHCGTDKIKTALPVERPHGDVPGAHVALCRVVYDEGRGRAHVSEACAVPRMSNALVPCASAAHRDVLELLLWCFKEDGQSSSQVKATPVLEPCGVILQHQERRLNVWITTNHGETVRAVQSAGETSDYIDLRMPGYERVANSKLAAAVFSWLRER